MISVPYPDGLWSNFTQVVFSDESLKDRQQKPIIQVKQGESLQESPAVLNRERKIWSWLTLGIPVLFETISLIYSGIIHREKVAKPALEVSFDVRDLMASLKEEAKRGTSSHRNALKIAQLVRYNLYNQNSITSTKKSDIVEVTQIMGRIVNEAEQARQQGDIITLKEKQVSLQPFLSFLEKSHNSKMSIKDFDESDWAVIDQIKFEQAKRFFAELSSVYNSDWLFGSRLGRQMRANFDVDYYESVVAENLALTLAYVEGLEHQTISLPVFDKKTKKYLPVTYTIRETRFGDSLPCYLLESEKGEAPTWLIVRGTSSYIGVSKEGKEYRKGGLESVLADALDHECISRNVLNKSLVHRPIVREGKQLVQKESISDIFRNWKLQNKKIKLSGHSLGGAIVNALTVEFYDQIETAYTFSSPGVSIETEKKWEELGTQRESGSKGQCKNQKHIAKLHSRKLVNFDYEGDFVPSGGRRLIGNHLAIRSTKHTGIRGLFETHVSSHLNNDCVIQKVDIVKENHKLSRYLCEKFRILIGKCFRLFLRLFDGKYIPNWWKHRKVYNEHANFERSIRKELWRYLDFVQSRGDCI